jgi:hypothetical protein
MLDLKFMNKECLPVLIVAHARPKDLKLILQSKSLMQRRIYLFVDKARSSNLRPNMEVIRIAETFKQELDLKVFVSKDNSGVGKGVPNGIRWISQYEDSFIVIEDDCHITEAGFKFLDVNSKFLSTEISMICASSPWDVCEESEIRKVNTLSQYPLIHGWCTNSNNWTEISRYLDSRPSFLKCIFVSVIFPSKALPIAYFLASVIRVNRGLVKAWDSKIALFMLLNDKRAVIPNLTMVTNSGRDAAASNTLRIPNGSRFLRIGSNLNPSKTLISKNKEFTATNKQVEKYIYGMKIRHLLSPFKSLLIRANYDKQ